MDKYIRWWMCRDEKSDYEPLYFRLCKWRSLIQEIPNDNLKTLFWELHGYYHAEALNSEEHDRYFIVTEEASKRLFRYDEEDEGRKSDAPENFEEALSRDYGEDNTN